MHHKLAQFIGYRLLLNLFFGSSQMDDWLLKYGHFKVLVRDVPQK
jgi:hypothetical protein